MAIDNQSQNLGTSASNSSTSATTGSPSSASDQNAMDIFRGSVTGALESVVREYEPQIAQFTQNLAHQAVDRGVSFVQTAGQRIQKQSWMRLGLAAALGLGVIAVLSYEASEAVADNARSDRSNNRSSSVH